MCGLERGTPEPRRLLALIFLTALAFGAACPLLAFADQINPAGNVIKSNPGMWSTYAGENLTNLGGIEAASTLFAFGMDGWGKAALTNSGRITVNAAGGSAESAASNADAFGMDGGDGALLTNSGRIAVTVGDEGGHDGHTAAYGMSLESGTAANYGLIRLGAPNVNGALAGQLAFPAPAAAAKDQAAQSRKAAGKTMPSRVAGMASAGDPAAPAAAGAAAAGRWQFFGTPYFSAAANHDLDYTGNSVGMLWGGTRRFNEQFAVGLHMGYSGSRAWGDLMDMDNTAQSGLFGLHAAFRFTPEWCLRSQFTGFISGGPGNYRSGPAENPLEAEADFNGHGFYAALNTGYSWQINESNTLTPEIGLSWLWSHQEDFSLNWKDTRG